MKDCCNSIDSFHKEGLESQETNQPDSAFVSDSDVHEKGGRGEHT